MIRDTAATDVRIEPTRRPWWRSRWLAGAGLVALAVAIAWPALSRFGAASESVALERLRTATVTRGRFVSDLSAAGRVVAAVSPTLYAPAAGRIALKVQAGDRVEKDQVLAELDSPELGNEFAREQANLAGLQATAARQRIEVKTRALANQQAVDLARVNVEAAERERRRAEEAHALGVLPQLEADRRADELATAKVRLRHAEEEARLAAESLAFELKTRELEVDRQRLVVANMQRRVDELSIRAPVGGVVGTVAVADRAAVAPAQPLLTVVDLSAFEIEIQVPESYAESLGLGMAAEISYGRQSLRGKLSAVSPEVRDNQVVARVRFDDAVPSDLRQNQRVSVRIVLDERDDVLMVARGPFYEAGSGRSAYVLREGLAHRTPITTGATSVGAIEIVDGLAAGDVVVIAGAESLTAATLLVND